jgi:hypothetical protein
MTTESRGGGEVEYELTLICGEGDRDYVREVFAHLKRRGVRAFYPAHEDFTVALLGTFLPESLDLVVRSQTRFAVVFVSRHLGESLANHQRRLALQRLIAAAEVFLLPVRMDDTELPGLPLTAVGSVDGRTTPARELARMLVRKLREREASACDTPPDVELHVERDPGRPPRAVVIRNNGKIAISGCVYVAQLRDPLRLRAWYLSPPADLAPGAEVRHVVRAPHGVEVATCVRGDTAVGAFLQTQRLTMLVEVRAFENEEAAAGERPETVNPAGLAFPPPSLFADVATPEGDSDLEAVMFGTGGGRLHRLLPHLSTDVETLEPDAERPAWAGWYQKVGRRWPHPPAAVTRPLPPPLTVGRRRLPR